MEILGLPEEEFYSRIHGNTWHGDWQSREVAFNRNEDGAIVICSVPSYYGGRPSIKDSMLGAACEIWLFPDGKYYARLFNTWIHNKRKGKVQKRKLKIRDGCYLHPTCETCPFPDCELSDIQAETSGVVIGEVSIDVEATADSSLLPR